MPSFCRRHQNEDLQDLPNNDLLTQLVCDFQSDGILRQDGRMELYFNLDTDVLRVPGLSFSAQIWSASDERNELDNRNVMMLDTVEKSAIDIIG